MHSLNTRRGLGLAAAMTLAAGALVAPTGAAAPADPNGSTIDPDAATTLTVHKCEQTDTNGVKEGTGNLDPQAECKPVSDVEFTITKLNVDLTTYDGWKTLADLKGNVRAVGDHKTTTVQKITTGPDGLASFTNDQTEVGAYLVSETRTPTRYPGRGLRRHPADDQPAGHHQVELQRPRLPQEHPSPVWTSR